VAIAGSGEQKRKNSFVQETERSLVFTPMTGAMVWILRVPQTHVPCALERW
jgi:hypothetical protein